MLFKEWFKFTHKLWVNYRIASFDVFLGYKSRVLIPHKNKSPAPHSSLRQRVFYFVLVLSWAARFVYSPMQLVMPSVVPIAVRIVTSVWIMVFQIVFLSISLIDN